jgi:hypothetical protein
MIEHHAKAGMRHVAGAKPDPIRAGPVKPVKTLPCPECVNGTVAARFVGVPGIWQATCARCAGRGWVTS